MSEAERTQWEARYQQEGRRLRDPSRFVVDAVSLLGPPGSAIDAGGGTGRNALWLAEQGWDVTLVDISPTALEIAAEDASARDLSLQVDCVDLDVTDPSSGPWDLVVIAHYLNRGLLGRISGYVQPGGHIVMAHPTIENLAKHDRPPRHYLLDPGELPRLLADFDIVSSFEGWTADDRHEAQIVARRPR